MQHGIFDPGEMMRKALFALLLLVAAWSALWVYASRVAGRQVDAWLAAEARQGRVWTCPDRAIGGYPLAITVSCSDPTFAGEALGQSVEGSLARAVAEASLLHPFRVAVTLAAPFAFRTSDGQTDVKGTWGSLAVDLGDIPDVRTMALHGTDVLVQGLFGEVGQAGGSAARLDGTFTLAANQPDPTVAFHVVANGAPVPALDQFIGGTAPLDVDLVGRVDRVDVGPSRTPEEALEHWRLAGGKLVLDASRAARADSRVVASGTLGLDDEHRPQGRLQAQFVGLQPILARYGISGNLAAAGSLLSSLFGGGERQTAPAEPGALSLPVSFQDGRLGIGPIRTQIALPPLY